MMNVIKEKRGIIFCCLFTYLAASSFISQRIYEATIPYASAVIFLMLGIMALPDLLPSLKMKDPDLILGILVMAVTPICMFLSSSGYGAFFIPADMALICYMAGRIKLSPGMIIYISVLGASPVILWYSHVRWSYNFNMAGFAFMIMCFFTIILLYRLDIPHRGFISVFAYATAFILSTLYHSRTAMAGMAAFGIFYLLLGLMGKKRGFHTAVSLILTAGSVAFTGLYILMSYCLRNARVLNKDIFSGREEIWQEIWEAFLKVPLYGVGSSFRLKSLGIFEVHNGMFDILAVHGIVVFLLISALIIRLFSSLGKRICAREMTVASRAALSAAWAMMFSSFFENFFVVPPYSIIFMAFILIADAGGWEKA